MEKVVDDIIDFAEIQDIPLNIAIFILEIVAYCLMMNKKGIFL